MNRVGFLPTVTSRQTSRMIKIGIRVAFQSILIHFWLLQNLPSAFVNRLWSIFNYPPQTNIAYFIHSEDLSDIFLRARATNQKSMKAGLKVHTEVVPGKSRAILGEFWCFFWISPKVLPHRNLSKQTRFEILTLKKVLYDARDLPGPTSTCLKRCRERLR